MVRKPTNYDDLPVEPLILTVRGQRVILDADLARVYGVPTKRLNEQVRRNADRFPVDFIFELTAEDITNLRPQIAAPNAGVNRSQTATGSTRGGRRYLPLAFTEHGAIMAATVLNSPRAVLLNSEVRDARTAEFSSAFPRCRDTLP